MTEVRIAIEMTYNARRKTLILLGLMMIITMIIAASLSQLELQPGMPLPKLENNQVVLAPIEEDPSVAVSINEFFKVLFFLALAGSMLYLIYRIIRGTGWKNLGPYIQPIIVISLIAGSIIFLIMLMPKTQGDFSMELPPSTDTPLVTSPLGPLPAVLLWLVGIALLVSSILLGIWIFAPSSRRETTIDLVGLEAEKAWQALITGLDLKDVIVNCYRQMSLALEQEQGIERQDFMTTREFENLLETAGVPHDPIHQLTRLFEAVRYGNWQPNPIDEQKAIHCLQAIVLYCREPKRTG
jgi:hypothetical protein